MIFETTDGFTIAREDLRIRGPGELLGPANPACRRYATRISKKTSTSSKPPATPQKSSGTHSSTRPAFSNAGSGTGWSLRKHGLVDSFDLSTMAGNAERYKQP